MRRWCGRVVFTALSTSYHPCIKFEGYTGFRHKLLFVTKGGMERLKHVVKRAGPVVSFASTNYDRVTGSEDEAIWYGAILKKMVILPRKVNR